MNGDVTQVLAAIERGEPGKAEELLPLVYAELRRLAAYRMANEAAGQTLQPTALVHEAWLRLVGSPQQTWQNRAHFFGAAAEAMRRILIEIARRKGAGRHGGGMQRLNLEDVTVAEMARPEQLLALDDALEKFARKEPKKAELVKLRFFAGLEIKEAAELLGISVPTADRWWAYARACLYLDIKNG